MYYYLVMFASGAFIFGLLFLNIFSANKSRKKTLVSLLCFFPLISVSYLVVDLFVSASINPIRHEYFESKLSGACLNAINDIKLGDTYNAAYKEFKVQEELISNDLKEAHIPACGSSFCNDEIIGLVINRGSWDNNVEEYQGLTIHSVSSDYITDGSVDSCAVLDQVGFYLFDSSVEYYDRDAAKLISKMKKLYE